MHARERFRRRGGIQSVWDFADPDHAGVGTVPYPRTPNLPASVIRVQKNPIAVRDGNFVLEEGQCGQNGALTRCPERPYDPERQVSRQRSLIVAGHRAGWSLPRHPVSRDRQLCPPASTGFASLSVIATSSGRPHHT